MDTPLLCHKLSLFLSVFGISTLIMNGQMPLSSRVRTIEEFNRGVCSICLVAEREGKEGFNFSNKKVKKESLPSHLIKDKITTTATKISPSIQEEASESEIDFDDDDDDDDDVDDINDVDDVDEVDQVDKVDEIDGDKNEGISTTSSLSPPQPLSSKVPSKSSKTSKSSKSSKPSKTSKTSKKAVQFNSETISSSKVGADSSNSSSSSSSPSTNQDHFKPSRGMDFQNVGVVVNFSFPTSFQSYLHRLGRTARGIQREGAGLSFLIEAMDSEQPLTRESKLMEGMKKSLMSK